MEPPAQPIASHRTLAWVGSPPAVPADVADELLRPRACPRCDYALEGLPFPGVCPECGQAYDASTVFLYGEAAGSRRQRSSVPRSRWHLVVQWAFSVFIIGFVFWTGGLRRPGSLMGFWWMPFSFVGLVIATWRGMSDPGSGFIQVRLGADGVRQGVRGLGAIPYERASQATPVPWRKVRRVLIEPQKNGQVKITCASTNDWWRFRTDYVAATVRCSPEATIALRQRVAGWRGMARANGSSR